MTPNWVAKILESDALWHVSRLLITFMYWYAGLGFLFDFTGAQETMGAFGFHPVWLVAALTLGTQLIGSALIIADRYVWFGAGMLGVFTLLTIPLTHDFWNMTGIEAMRRGRPVVGADHGGIPEWLVDSVGGWRFRPGDAQHLASAARMALDDGGDASAVRERPDRG